MNALVFHLILSDGGRLLPLQAVRNKYVSVAGVNPPSDKRSARALNVRGRSLSADRSGTKSAGIRRSIMPADADPNPAPRLASES